MTLAILAALAASISPAAQVKPQEICEGIDAQDYVNLSRE